MKTDKTPGPDNLPTDLLKLVEEDYIDKLTDLFKKIYKTGILPNEWLKSTFVAWM